MPQPPTTPVRSDATAEVELAQRLAELLQTASVFPATHRRVQQILRDVLNSPASTPRGFRVQLRGGQIAAEGQPVWSETASLAWLSEHMQATSLAGIELGQGLTEHALIDFANRLGENYARRERGLRFDRLWPVTFAGIRLVEHRQSARPMAEATERGAATNEERAGTRHGRVLAELLEASGDIHARVAEITGALAGGEDRPVDLLGRLVDLLPAEVFESPACALGIIDLVLGEVREIVTDGLTWNDLEGKLRSTVFRVSSDYFRTVARSTPRTSKGDPYDNTPFRDDPAALAREVARLPLATELTVDDRVLATEQLAVLLHLTSREGDPSPQLLEQLVARLQTADKGETQVLRYYLERLLGETGRRNAGLKQIAQAMQRAGLDGVVARDCGLSSEVAATFFPTALGLFLDHLQEDELDKVAHLCKLVGEDRIRAARSELIGAQGCLNADRIERVLTRPRREVLPLVRVIATHEDGEVRVAVVRFLQQLRLNSPESSVLYVLPPELLPLDYLCGLCDVEGGHGWSGPLREQAGAMLRDYVAQSATDENLERRIYAIERLGDFRSPETEKLLNSMLESRGPFGIGGSKQPRPVRDVAASILRRFAESDDQDLQESDRQSDEAPDQESNDE